uniref:Uncharacterized protein n=1 Tax=Corethron hystrix TaxID=216773 RepID=A0A7S1FQT9_9STRA|mmetsp:Transcript_21416/g.48644  ORF Transcript_21416/g.48644 Transcript_21416/m.48644 type:complete len:138 (+) Transcript_21416:202-615(+)
MEQYNGKGESSSECNSDDESSPSAPVCNDRAESTQRTANHRKKKKQKNKNKKNPAAPDDLRRWISRLMRVFEDRSLFLPLPESTAGQRKVWSNRSYGADKKRQRKKTERGVLEARARQLVACLEGEHGLSAADIPDC